MAENKKKVIIYTDWQDQFENLSDAEAGRLIKHFFRYVNDQKPVYPDRITEIAFTLIKSTLKRDLVKWENTLEEKSKAGKASAEARRLFKLSQQNPTNPTPVDFAQQNPTNPTVIDSVSVIDSVIDKDTYKSFLHLSLSKKEFDELFKIYTKEQIDSAIMQIENHKNNKNYNSLSSTVLFWLKDKPKKTDVFIPEGYYIDPKDGKLTRRVS